MQSVESLKVPSIPLTITAFEILVVSGQPLFMVEKFALNTPKSLMQTNAVSQLNKSPSGLVVLGAVKNQ